MRKAYLIILIFLSFARNSLALDDIQKLTIDILERHVPEFLEVQARTPPDERSYGNFGMSNVRVQECTYVLAYLYQEPESIYYHNEDVFHSIIINYDYLVRAQGSDGGFPETKGWCGVDPEGRKPTGEPPTAFTMYAIAKAFNLLYERSMVIWQHPTVRNIVEKKDISFKIPDWSLEDLAEIQPQESITYEFVPQKDFEDIMIHGHYYVPPGYQIEGNNVHILVTEDSVPIFDRDVRFEDWEEKGKPNPKKMTWRSNLKDLTPEPETFMFREGKTYRLTIKNIKEGYVSEGGTGDDLYIYIISSSDLFWLSDTLDREFYDGIGKYDNRWNYFSMFQKAIDFYRSHNGRGHAPNQDVVDLNALYELNKSQKILTNKGYPPGPSDDFISESELNALRDEILDTINPQIEHAKTKNEYGKWFTRKYLPLESGTGAGWDSNYGAIIAHFLYVYSEHDIVVGDFLQDYYNAIQYFLTPDSVEGIAEMQWDGAWEGNTSRRVGGTYMHLASMLDPQNPVAVRMHYKLLTNINHDVPFHVDDPFKYDLFEYVDFLRYYHEPVDPGYRLPNERPDGYIWYDSEARVLIARENGRTDYAAFDWGGSQQARVNEHDMTAVVGDGERYYGFDQQTDRFYGIAYTPPGLETPKVLWRNLSSSVSQHLTRIMVRAVDDTPLLNTVNASGQVVSLGDTPTESLVAKPLPFLLTPSSGTVDILVTKWKTTDDYVKEWTETASDAGTATTHRVGDFPSNVQVAISVDGQPLGTKESDADGYIDFTYSGGFATPAHTFKLVASLNPPNPLSPPDGSAVDTLTPTLTWEGEADSYTTQIAKDSGFTDIVDVGDNITALSYTVPSGKLSDGIQYYWRVQGRRASLTSDWSKVMSFSIDSIPPAIQKTYPANGAVDVPVEADIQVVFSEPMNQSATENGFSIQPQIQGTFSWTSETTLVFHPDSDFNKCSVYVVTIKEPAKDLAGNPLPRTSWSFTTEGRLGDVSGDGNITAYDASLVLKYAVGLITLPEPLYPCFTLETADVSGNKKITAMDASYILQYSVGKIQKFPVETGEFAIPVVEASNVSLPSLRSRTGLINNATAKQGSIFALPIVIDHTQELYAVEMTINFDQNILSAVTVTNENMPKDSQFEYHIEPGEVRLSLASAGGLNSKTLLSAIRFQVTSNRPTQTESIIRFTKLRFNDILLPEREILFQLLPRKFALLQNYPNPFNPETWIPYQLPKSAEVVIKIYNLKGQLIKILDLGGKEAGFYLSKDKAGYWDGKNELGEDVSSGAYWYTIHAGEYSAMRKMVLVK